MSQDRPRPREVDGFRRAAELGLLPRVPPTPPPRLPGPTARRALLDWLATISVGVLVWVAVAGGVSRLAHRMLPFVGPVVLVLGALAAFVLLFVRQRSRVGRIYLGELAVGYTTLPLAFGAFWGLNSRQGPNYREPWDFRGLWILDGSGRVRSAPDPAVDPPGLYPSPERAGMLQLWTGSVWARRFEEPGRPFLP